MADPAEHPSMILYGAAGRNLASREIALTLARMILSDVFGDPHPETTVSITDSGDRWIVEEARPYQQAPEPWGQRADGPAVIEIAKRNCAIIRLSRMTGPYDPADGDLPS
jgi:hypothetical protein